MPYANSEGPDERAHPCSLISSTYTRDQLILSGQRMPRSACTNAQADEDLRCSQTA